eukprot:gene38978-18342_t
MRAWMDGRSAAARCAAGATAATHSTAAVRSKLAELRGRITDHAMAANVLTELRAAPPAAAAAPGDAVAALFGEQRRNEAALRSARD